MIEFILNIGLPLLFLFLGYFIGQAREKSHLDSLRKRELASVKFPVFNTENIEGVDNVFMVCGEAVISIDYFKRLGAALKNLFGGNISFYESLVNRARREAILRMKEDARSQGASAVCNLRIITSNIGGAAQGSVTGVEVIAYGTALYKRRNKLSETTA